MDGEGVGRAQVLAHVQVSVPGAQGEDPPGVVCGDAGEAHEHGPAVPHALDDAERAVGEEGAALLVVVRDVHDEVPAAVGPVVVVVGPAHEQLRRRRPSSGGGGRGVVDGAHALVELAAHAIGAREDLQHVPHVASGVGAQRLGGQLDGAVDGALQIPLRAQHGWVCCVQQGADVARGHAGGHAGDGLGSCVGALAKDGGERRDGAHAAGDDVAEQRPGLDAGELVRVADEQELARGVAEAPQQPQQEAGGHHGDLVDDDDAGGALVLVGHGVVLEARDEAVNGARGFVAAEGLGHARRRLARGGEEPPAQRGVDARQHAVAAPWSSPCRPRR